MSVRVLKGCTSIYPGISKHLSDGINASTYLVDSRVDTRVGVKQLLKVLDAVVAHAPGLDLSVLNGIFNSPPRLESRLLPSVRAVQQEQVNVPEVTSLERLLDGLPRDIVRPIGCKLGSEVNVFPLQAILVVGAREESLDCLAALAFIVVHLSGIDT